MIKRDIENILLKYINNFPVVGVIGPRQVGKTTLVKAISEQLRNKPVLYLDLEKPFDIELLKNPETLFSQNIEKTIIIDEIQHKPELFPIIRSLVDIKRENGRFIILGSASPEIIRKSAETLAGRIVYVELSGFSYLEIENHITYKQHIIRGGFPNASLEEDDELRSVWMDNFISTYVERYFPMLGLNANPAVLRRFWTMLAHYNSNIWNASQFANSLGVSVPTVQRYFDFLEGSFITTILRPYHINIKKRLVKSPKVYFRDSGIATHLIGIDSYDALQNNTVIGATWESYAVEQIRHAVANANNIQLYYYRTQRGAECDLVITKGEKPVATVEIKHSNLPSTTKGYSSAIQDINIKDNYVITPSAKKHAIKENIIVNSLVDFLKTDLIKYL